MKIYKVIKLIAIFSLLITLLLISYSFYKVNALISNLPNFDIKKIYVNESTKVYDKDNNIILELGIEQRDIVEYKDISSNMINAITSIEDEKFFEHNGIDYKRIVAALFKNVQNLDYTEGASTITQQLVKLSFLSTDKTLERKVKEIFLSIELEEKISKEEILEAYLNKVLFGGRIYGVEKASHYYFNKSAKDLNYEESAILAGIIQSPNRFNPYTNPYATKNRQITVLNAMFNNNFISKEQFELAVNRPLEHIVKEKDESIDYQKYNEYIDYVLYELKNKYKLDPFNDGLKIYSYLDTEIQDSIYEIENNNEIHPNNNTQTGIVVMETQTGIIRAIGGGRNYQGSLSFNFAIDAKRQPGSTIKPILDYGPVIEYLNYSPAQPYLDDLIYYNTLGSRFVPVLNYDNKYKGHLTMREAIIDSRNVTAVKAYREAGTDNAYKFAKNLGLDINEEKIEAHAIGGFKYGFSVLEMASAYTAFGNKGIYNEPTSIDYIMKDNKKIEIKQKSNRAMKTETAYLMSDILHENMIVGTANRANVNNLFLAGKTGQTNFNYETREKYHFPANSVRDSWFTGYSSKYTTAVWLGYDKLEKDAYLTPNEAKVSLEIFKMIMGKIHQNNYESMPFYKPDNIIEVEVEIHTDPLLLPSEYTPSMYRKKELFIKGYEPTKKSLKFKSLDTPKNFIVYFDDENNNISFRWDRYKKDYTNEEYKLMQNVNKIKRDFDRKKDHLVKEYYQNHNDFYSSFISNDIKDLYEEYCQDENENLCDLNQNSSLSSFLLLLDKLKDFQIEKILKDKQVNILTEGEISDLRGYETWNGYRNGIYSNLGNIEYKIIGNKGLIDVVLYKGPYIDEVNIKINLKEFLDYDSFYIVTDYSKYPCLLQSKKNISINPFISI